NIAAEFSVALFVLHFGRETGGRVHPECVIFAHTPDDTAEIERILGCAVRTAASRNGLAISREAWEQSLFEEKSCAPRSAGRAGRRDYCAHVCCGQRGF